MHLHGSSEKKLQMALLVDVLLVHKNKLSLLVGIRTLLFSRLINSNLPLIKKISRSNKMYSVSKQIFAYRPYTNIFKSLNSVSNSKVYEFEVKPHIWGREIRWGKLVTMEPEKHSPAWNWYMRWRKRHYRRGKKNPDSSLVWCIDSSVYDRDVTEMKASINISSITCWAFGGILPCNIWSTSKWG